MLAAAVFAHHHLQWPDQWGLPNLPEALTYLPPVTLTLALAAFVMTVRLWMNKGLLDTDDAIYKEEVEAHPDADRLKELTDRRGNYLAWVKRFKVAELLLAAAGWAILGSGFGRWFFYWNVDASRPFSLFALWVNLVFAVLLAFTLYTLRSARLTFRRRSAAERAEAEREEAAARKRTRDARASTKKELEQAKAALKEGEEKLRQAMRENEQLRAQVKPTAAPADDPPEHD